MAETPPSPSAPRPSPAEPEVPVEPKKATIVYEGAAQIRDLRKEATRFVPAVVQQKLKQAKGEKGLLDEEEYDRLEREGYMDGGRKKKETIAEATDPDLEALLAEVGGDDATGGIAQNIADAAEKEAQFKMMAAEAEGKMQNETTEGLVAEKKLRQVEIEEVEDEDL